MDFGTEEHYADLKRLVDPNGSGEYAALSYLAVDPDAVPAIAQYLAQHGFAQTRGEGWFRVIIEKPFGHDLASAQVLDQKLSSLFTEEQIYRIDHYLAKETVQNILAFRFANGIFEPLWSNEYIDHVQITVAEEDGIRTRGAYYDQAGAVRDFLQNHILQLLAILTMEEPMSFTFNDLSDASLEILQAVQFNLNHTVFGQYEGYKEEGNVSPISTTETYIMTEAEIATARWRGVPFYMRTGKHLTKRISEVSIQFKTPTQNLFHNASTDHRANLLTFRLQPDEGISLQLAVKTPEKNMQVQPVSMEFCYANSFTSKLPEAYSKVLHDALQGDRSLTLCNATIEESWRAVTPLLEAKATLPLHTYAKGSWGPEAADHNLEEVGRSWFTHESEVCNGVRIINN